MTRRERAIARLERRREWAASRERMAAAAFAGARAAVAGIEPGQPILVGHHSEGKHRRALERHDSRMHAGFESQNMAAHHLARAGGIEQQLERTVFSDDPDAIEQLQAKIDSGRATVERMKAANKIVRKFKSDTHNGILALEQAGFTAGQAQRLFTPDFAGRLGFPSYELTNLGANIRRMEARIAEIQRQEERQARCESAGGVLIEGETWVRITFDQKPEREIMDALRGAGFRWGGGSWSGERARIPACVLELTAKSWASGPEVGEEPDAECSEYTESMAEAM